MWAKSYPARSLGARQYRRGACRKPQVAVEPALEFEHKRRPLGDQIGKIAEGQLRSTAAL